MKVSRSREWRGDSFLGVVSGGICIRVMIFGKPESGEASSSKFQSPLLLV